MSPDSLKAGAPISMEQLPLTGVRISRSGPGVRQVADLQVACPGETRGGGGGES